MALEDNRHAPKGKIWVCPGCGRKGKDRFELGDTSCVTWAILCFEKRGKDGKYRAVPTGN